MSNQLPIMEIDRSPTGADTGLSAAGLQRIRDDLDAEVAAANLPGAVVMLVRNDRPAFAYVTGYLDPVARTPMCLDALFRIYSMTKPLTSVGAMMLVEQGVLALGDRIADHLPEMRGARGETTVLHLLLHASGLTYGTRSQDATIRQAYEEFGLVVNPRELDAQHLLYGLARVPLLQMPGTSWEYGLSTDLLGLIVESVTGQRLGIHPAWYGLSLEDARSIESAHAVEIYNHTSAVKTDRGDSSALYDQLLAEGLRLSAFASDDAHFHFDDAFGAWVMVKADSNQPELLLESLKQGHYYSTQGPLIHDISIDAGQLHVKCSAARAVILLGRASKAVSELGVGIESATLATEGVAKGGYGRVVVISDDGRRAWSNPIWFA